MAGKAIRKGSTSPVKKRSPLPLIIGVVALLMIVLGLLASRRPAVGGTGDTAMNGPRLAVDQDKIDFGQVRVDNVVKADFRFQSVGNQPLQIIGEPTVRVAQGC